MITFTSSSICSVAIHWLWFPYYSWVIRVLRISQKKCWVNKRKHKQSQLISGMESGLPYRFLWQVYVCMDMGSTAKAAGDFLSVLTSTPISLPPSQSDIESCPYPFLSRLSLVARYIWASRPYKPFMTYQLRLHLIQWSTTKHVLGAHMQDSRCTVLVVAAQHFALGDYTGLLREMLFLDFWLFMGSK